MVQEGLENTVIPVPNEEILNIIKNVTEENKKMEIAEKLLYQWLKNQPNFPNDYEKNIVKNFLRGCKFDVERTKNLFQQHYANRHLYPDIFSRRHPASDYLTKATNCVNIGTLPTFTLEGYRTFIFKFHECSDDDIVAGLKYFFAAYDLLMKNPDPVAGEIAILDVRELTAAYLLKAFPHMKNAILLLRKAYAVRLKRLHVIVAPSSGIEKLLALLRPVLHPKVRENILVHDDVSKLHEYYPEHTLPSNFGGSNKSLKDIEEGWQQLISNHAEWLDEHHKYVELEIPSKENSSYFKDDLGINGCFRKLEID